MRKLRLIVDGGGNLVELIGLVYGDGSSQNVIKGKSYRGGRISYGSKDLELTQRVGVLMAKVLGRERPYTRLIGRNPIGYSW